VVVLAVVLMSFEIVSASTARERERSACFLESRNCLRAPMRWGFLMTHLPSLLFFLSFFYFLNKMG
jgi:hypothetical protein